MGGRAADDAVRPAIEAAVARQLEDAGAVHVGDPRRKMSDSDASGLGGVVWHAAEGKGSVKKHVLPRCPTNAESSCLLHTLK